MGSTRPFDPGVFDVSEDKLVVCDRSLPLMAEVDPRSGELRRLHSWPLVTELRDRPVASDVLIAKNAILVSSPAAGGIVRFETDGATTVVPLDADPGTMTIHDDTVWVVAHPDWNDEADDYAAEDDEEGLEDDQDATSETEEGRKRPVVWEEPTAEEIQMEAEMARHFFFAPSSDTSSDAEDEEWPTTVAEWQAEEGNEEPMEAPQPVWKVSSGIARRANIDAESIRLYSLGDQMLVVCRLPSDPIVKHVSPDGGSVEYRYPYSILLGRTPEEPTQLATFASSGSVSIDAGRAWLLGFGDYTESGGMRQYVRELDLAGPQVGPPVAVDVAHPWALVNGHVVDVFPTEEYDPRNGATARLVPLNGEPATEVALPGFFPWDLTTRVAEPGVWFGPIGGTFIALDTHGRIARRLVVDFDCAGATPTPTPPPGVETGGFEQRMLEEVRRELLSPWVSEQDSEKPLIEGVSFESIELHGGFPEAEIVAIFRSNERPGRRYGQRWVLWDELGNPVENKYGVGIYLMEDVESGRGIAKFDSRTPDEDGIVWI